MNHGQYIMGPEVMELEDRLATYVGIKHAISCSSGTDALLLALMAYDIGDGDAIFTPPFTFISTAEVISILGATPIFVDIDPITFNLDPEKLEQAIQALKATDPALHPLPSIKPTAPDFSSPTSDLRPPLAPLNSRQIGTIQLGTSGLTPRGVIPVDLFGLAADYDSINSIAQKHDLFVIEDAAQSFGAEYKGKKACSLADIACTSFFPAKPLGCYGDGGMCFTEDDSTAEIMRSLRIHGQGTNKYDNVRVGVNGRMDTLQSAILLAKFDIFPDEVELRQKVAKHYTELLAPCSMLNTPCVSEGYKSVWAQYSVLAKDEQHRSAIQAKLKDAGIPTAIYYPKPLHLQDAFAFLGYKEGEFPISESISKRIFSLPMHPYLQAEDQQRIAEILNEV